MFFKNAVVLRYKVFQKNTHFSTNFGTRNITVLTVPFTKYSILAIITF